MQLHFIVLDTAKPNSRVILKRDAPPIPAAVAYNTV